MSAAGGTSSEPMAELTRGEPFPRCHALLPSSNSRADDGQWCRTSGQASGTTRLTFQLTVPSVAAHWRSGY
jgi:hypothetical protein